MQKLRLTEIHSGRQPNHEEGTLLPPTLNLDLLKARLRRAHIHTFFQRSEFSENVVHTDSSS